MDDLDDLIARIDELDDGDEDTYPWDDAMHASPLHGVGGHRLFAEEGQIIAEDVHDHHIVRPEPILPTPSLVLSAELDMPELPPLPLLSVRDQRGRVVLTWDRDSRWSGHPTAVGAATMVQTAETLASVGNAALDVAERLCGDADLTCWVAAESPLSIAEYLAR